MSELLATAIDSRLSTLQRFNYRSSIVDEYTRKLRIKLKDDTLGDRLVGKALNKLGEAQVNAIAEYSIEKATTNAGHLFVSICVKAMAS